MMLDPREIYPLTDLHRNARDHIAKLRETGRPAVLTVNGRAELVVQSAEAYQKLVEALDRAETLLGIHRGRADVLVGEVMPLHEAFEQIRAEIAR
jgi:PHD/YefM family antitoxin component YafN of YafNO toxin-antitoxin module